jgi:hypothetical protein
MINRLIVIVFIASVSLPGYASENILTPMIGVTGWSDNSDYTIRGVPTSFRNNNETTYGFRYLYMFDNGFAVGGDIYGYRKDVDNNPVQANYAGVVHIHALAEYFFYPQDSFTPFIGGGIGVTGMGFSGGVLDDDGTGGGSIELNAGMLFRMSKMLSVQVEYKLTSFDMNEDIDSQYTDVSSTANSVMMGLNIHL